jgi:WD40 repeat protein
MCASVLISLLCIGQAYHEHARMVGDNANLRSVAFSPDGRFLASLSKDGTLKLWEVASARNVATLEDRMNLSSFAFMPHGTKIVTGTYKGTLGIWDYADASFKPLISRRRDRHSIHSLAVSPSEGGAIAVGMAETISVGPRLSRLASRIELIDAKSLETIRLISSDESFPPGVWFSPDGKRLAFSGSDFELCVEDIAGRTRKKFSFPENDRLSRIYSVAFSTDGKFIACGSHDKTARVWRLDDATLLGTLEGHGLAVHSILFIDDNASIATGSLDSSIRIWRTSDCREIQAIVNQTASINSMSYFPKGGLIASVDTGNDVILWAKDKK